MQTKMRIVRKENYDPKELNLHETLFSNANGYIGIRGTLEEGVPRDYPTMRGQYVSGAYEIIPMKQAESLCNLVEEKETMVNAGDTQTIKIMVGDEEFAPWQGTVSESFRILDMAEGFTERELLWESPSGKRIKIRIRRMAHFSIPELFTIEMEIRPLNFTGDVMLDSYHIPEAANFSDPDDPRLADESPCYLKTVEKGFLGEAAFSVTKTEKSGVRIAMASSHSVSGETESEVLFREDHGIMITRIRFLAKEGETLTVVKRTAFSDSIREEDPKAHALAVLKSASSRELKDLYEDQKKYLAAFHQNANMEIEGDPELSGAVSFNMYQLLSSAPRDRYASIAAKGLSGEGYEGHYFWDTEMYVVPFFLLTDPALARNILSFRYKTLEKARENAALLGHEKGALYPWRTITGTECSGYFPSGTAAYHINGAVAYAVIQYYLATDDEEYMKQEGLEILLETARLWLDTGVYDRKGNFKIHTVTGPDEYTCMVDNNYYTNASAKYNLSFAADLSEKWKEDALVRELMQRLGIEADEIREMKKAADQMYFPFDEELGINPQDDSFLEKPVWDLKATPKEKFPLLLHYHPLHLYRYQVCKQADTVLAHFLFPELEKKEVREKSFRYYEKITTHDSSLSTCVFSMTASTLSLKKEAMDYFGDSAKLDLYNLHGNTKDGVHTANMGGSYMAIVNGFGGIRFMKEGLSVNPFLPEGIDGYAFSFRFRGRHLYLSVKKEECSLSLLQGDPVECFSHGERHVISKEEPWISTP